ncbi:MAG: hypothetical protein MJE77_19370 [Proteobacteria bacterium]|nr:hypothetical protein [Pseudomonadota bacterium]
MIKTTPLEAADLEPGAFIYTDLKGKLQAIYFQFNPEKLTRSRTATFKETDANDRQGTTTARGAQGKKYTLTVERWKIDLDIRLDASKPAYVGTQPPPPDFVNSPKGEDLAKKWRQHLEKVKLQHARLTSVAEGLSHLEALIEPGPIPSENDDLYGFSSLPDPPMIQFLWGERIWAGFMTSLSISEVQFTPQLSPKRVEATVSLVILETLRQLQQGKTGGKQ